jgi:hypothetical protein
MKNKIITKKVKKPAAKRPLLTAPDAAAFYTVDGQRFVSLAELATGLRTMERRVYQFHADKSYQDFAVWVATVFKNKPLAAALKKATTAMAAAKCVDVVLKEDLR